MLVQFSRGLGLDTTASGLLSQRSFRSGGSSLVWSLA